MPVRTILSLFLAAAFLITLQADTARAAPAKKTAREIAQCKALNKCRARFTRCYYAIKNDSKKKWDTHDHECSKPYSDCIAKHFGPFERFFTRMFDPRVQDCSKW